jgi:hypothetical protein
MKSFFLLAAACLGLVCLVGCGDSSSGTASGTSTLVGGPCMNGSDCDEGLCQMGAQYPGGVCTISCGNTGQCPSNSTCAELDGGWVCLVNCQATEECRTQWTCEAVVEAGTNGGSVKSVCIGPTSTP